jgi:hypothetical protein
MKRDMPAGGRMTSESRRRCSCWTWRARLGLGSASTGQAAASSSGEESRADRAQSDVDSVLSQSTTLKCAGAVENSLLRQQTQTV